ncbi:Proton/glutamate-aspartate symporter [Sinobacterium norvegicum]|uniref:Proton/glutamate-aspartate symporter n=1 Tax=Sinobacterium norvegicum TaxID=1641715 RepID=A0ABN8EFV4_9GAMM|nr:dicarboxylate/amino acid:cation symporter [Sinobacterium norvegicum]CAH0991295.1 Proton/glutamate-aspartate symporter [Sinobacterium norvegicum]
MSLTAIRSNLTAQTLIAGILGYLLSVFFASPEWLEAGQMPVMYQVVVAIKVVFLSALTMLVAPMVFFSIINGVLQLKEPSQLGTLGRYTLGYYLLTTSIAIAIGLVAVFFVHPWEAFEVQLQAASALEEQITYQQPGKLINHGDDSFVTILQQMMKRALSNPFASLASNNVLGIVCFAFLSGIALVVTAKNDSPIIQLVADINAMIFKMLSWILAFLPLAVFSIVFDFQLRMSGDIIGVLLSFMAVVIGATLLHGLVILPLIAKFAGGVGYRQLFSATAKPLMLAVTSSSSAATLPASMQASKEGLHVDPSIGSFVLPLGATVNMDGTALFEGIAAIFLAYLFGIELSSIHIVVIFLMAMVSSIGAPGMPTGSMSGMQIVLLAVGIPLEGIGILLVVERPLDMLRTGVNVLGDLVGSRVVQQQLTEEIVY